MIGDIVKKDGTRGAREVRLGPIPKADIPGHVWEALRAMRPDLTR